MIEAGWSFRMTDQSGPIERIDSYRVKSPDWFCANINALSVKFRGLPHYREFLLLPIESSFCLTLRALLLFSSGASRTNSWFCLQIMAGQAEPRSHITQHQLCRLLRLGMVAAHASGLAVPKINGWIQGRRRLEFPSAFQLGK